MKRIILLISILISLPVFASEYSVNTPDNYSYSGEEGERTLFILDFSNSMSEYLEGARKVDLMLDTMKKILPKINPDSFTGLRVYGHKMGANANNIASSLAETAPKGMTPITFSLKEAVKHDFMGFTGKKHIILLTDGGENCDESPCKWVMELVKIRKDVKIDVIAFNVTEADDLDQLECTSLVTGGKFYSANTAAELARSLNNSINVKKDVEAKIIRN